MVSPKARAKRAAENEAKKAAKEAEVSAKAADREAEKQREAELQAGEMRPRAYQKRAPSMLPSPTLSIKTNLFVRNCLARSAHCAITELNVRYKMSSIDLYAEQSPQLTAHIFYTLRVWC